MNILRTLENKLAIGGFRPVSALVAATIACLLYNWFEYPVRALVSTGVLHAPNIYLSWLPEIVLYRLREVLPCLIVIPIAMQAGRHGIFIVCSVAGLVIVGGGTIFSAMPPLHIFNATYDFGRPLLLSFFLSNLAPWVFFGAFLQFFTTKQPKENSFSDDLNGFKPYLALLSTGAVAILFLVAHYLFLVVAGYWAPFAAFATSTVTMLFFGANPLTGVFGGLSAIMLTHKLPARLAVPTFFVLALFPGIQSIGITMIFSIARKFGVAPLAYTFGMYLAGAAVYGALLLWHRQKVNAIAVEYFSGPSAAQTAS